MAAQQASSRLEMLQARFQQRQLAEKEQKLLQLYDQQQIRAHQVAQRGSAGSNDSNGSAHGNSGNMSHHQTITKTSTTTHSTSNSQGGGKVRQMFDERRQTNVKGIDKSYPLEPLENRSRKHQTTVTTSNVSVDSSSLQKNGNPMGNRRSVVTRKTVRSEASSNVNDGKPVVTYHEEVSREINDSNDRHKQQDEFGDELCRYENGNRRIDRPTHLNIEDVTNENTSQRYETTAKIHLAGMDRSNVTKRTNDNVENEQLFDNEIIDAPERLPRRLSAGKKTLQTETRFERAKNTNVKKIGQAIKQINAGNPTSFTKKLKETTVRSGSTSRASTATAGMEEGISRASSASPEYEVAKKTRYPSPEVSDKEKFSPATRSPVSKTSGVTRVSQISHRNTTDFYPRRKSEFEKSKTFRKLQLELGESSPEPNESEQVSSIIYGKYPRKRSSILNDNIYSSEGRSSSSSPFLDRAYSKERKISHETSSERPGSRRGSQSSTCRKESITKNTERKANSAEIGTSSFDSSTYSSRRRSSSSNHTIDHDFSEERRTRHERPASRAENQTSIYGKESVVNSDSTRRRSSTPSPTIDHVFSKLSNKNDEKSSDGPGSRKKSSNSIYGGESTTEREERKTSRGVKKSSFDSSTYSSRHHSTATEPIPSRRYPKERETDKESWYDGAGYPKGSRNPKYQGQSVMEDGERKTTSGLVERSSLDSRIADSRHRSSFSSPTIDRRLSKERNASHEESRIRSGSREDHHTTTHRRESTTKSEETDTNCQSSTYSSRQHSFSQNPIVNYDLSMERRTSSEISRERPGSRGRSGNPSDRMDSVVTSDGKNTWNDRIDRYNLKSGNLPSNHHSSFSSSIDRTTYREKSPEYPGSRRKSLSPSYRTESEVKSDERRTTSGENTSNFASSTYCSKQRTTSPPPRVGRGFSEEKRTSHELSHEGSGSRERSHSPTYRTEFGVKFDGRKTTSGENTSNFASSTYSSRQHTISPPLAVGRDFTEERRSSHELSHEGSNSRERSESPTHRAELGAKFDHRKTASRDNDLDFTSSTYSSRQHTIAPRPAVECDFSEERRTSHDSSYKGSNSRERSQSPTHRADLGVKFDDRKTTSGENTANFASSTYSSRQRTISPPPAVGRDFTEERRSSHELSHEGLNSRERFQSPTHSAELGVKFDDRKTMYGDNASHFASSTYSSRQHTISPSPADFPEHGTSHDISHKGSNSRERSQSPTHRAELGVKFDDRKTTYGDNASHFASSTYSSRQHTISPSPADFPEHGTSHDISHKGSNSRERSQSPTHSAELGVKFDDRKTMYGDNPSHFASSTYSSRQHTISPSPADFSEDGTSHDISHKGSNSRERSQSPTHRLELGVKFDDRKTTYGDNASHFASSTYSSRQHTISPSPADFPEHGTSHDISHKGSNSRERSQSPTHRAELGDKFDDRKTMYGDNPSHFASSTYSSRQHTISPSPADFSEEHETSHAISHHSNSRERSESPIHQRAPYAQNVETKAPRREIRTSTLESCTRSPRSSSSSPTPTATKHDVRKNREHEDSLTERLGSRRGSQSPIHRRESIIKKEGKNTTSEDTSSTYLSRRRSSSSGPIVDFVKEHQLNHDRDGFALENRRKSGGNLRSVELVKKLVHSPSPRKRPTTKSVEGRITLEDIEFSEKNSILREDMKVTDRVHKITKKDKASMEKITKPNKVPKTGEMTNTRSTRSRTISPSPVKKSTEKTVFKAKKIESKTSSDVKEVESKNRRNIEEIELTDKKKKDKFNSDIRPTTNGKDSRRSSSEITVKRHDTFKVSKPSQKILKIDSDELSNKTEVLSGDRKLRDKSKNKSQLLERIEKIRSTLSRSGRSEQDLQSQEYERTDSVESALKRFDSIGVETEHHVTVGVDEPDITSRNPSSDLPYSSSNDQKIPVSEKIFVKKTVTPLCKTTQAKVTAEKIHPRKTEVNNKLTCVNVREKNRDIVESSKSKKEKSTTTSTTPRHSDNKMVAKSREGQKRVTSMVKKSKLRGEESSGRGERRELDDSPICKRKLFVDSESEIENENSRSTIVLTTITRSTGNSPDMIQYETRKNCDNIERVRSTKSPADDSTIDHEPTKVLRSIEDIRKSIKHESEDFKRELNKFNRAMRKDAESSSMKNADSIVTSGSFSRVRITKSFKSDDRVPIVKIEKTTVKLPITRRVAKSPSPDIGTKRTTEGRTRTMMNAVRKSVPSSPAKSPDTANRNGSSELRISGAKSVGRIWSSTGSRESENQREFSITTEYLDSTDDPGNNSGTGILSATITEENNGAFAIDSQDNDGSKNNANNPCIPDNGSIGKRQSEGSLTPRKQSEYRSSTAAPSSRPNSALSTISSSASARGRSSSRTNSKVKMSTSTKSSTSNGPRGSTNNSRTAPPATTNVEDGLVACHICGRRFNSDRVARHEQICSKTSTKKRKQFDATIHRVKGTELEPFVKKGGARKSQPDKKAQKPEVKSNWRRKHEDFINAIRSAKQVQAHLAAGGKLSDLPPPPPSDTSDYVQCPHCGRKFNQTAAERHIPKCQTMMHNKPNPRAPPKPKR